MFGMPSGHAQSSFYTLIFIFFALYPAKILYLYIIITLITLFQRFYFKHHSIIQLIIGTIIGIFTGYVMYFFASQSIKGKITEKIDDFAPV
jgi:membrane-associated phospholipid phosphatase